MRILVLSLLLFGVQNRALGQDNLVENRVSAPTLDELVDGKLRLVDLTHSLNESSAHWPGENYEPFRLRTLATLEKNGVLSKAFSMPEHLGTHLDAPNHFARNQISAEQIRPEDLVARGVMIDISGRVSSNSDYRISLADVKAWEKEQGPISARTVVLLRTGWDRFWDQPDRYRNQDVRGKMHFPGFSSDAASYLLQERDVLGLGIDTLSLDYGLSTDFPVHHLVNERGRYGLENLANLKNLPARGFYLVIAPIKIEAGTGGPTRIFAILK